MVDSIRLYADVTPEEFAALMDRKHWMLTTQDGELFIFCNEDDATNTAAAIGIVWNCRPVGRHMSLEEHIC